MTSPSGTTPATIYTGGPIYPQADGHTVQALAVRGGRVLAAGTWAEARAAVGADHEVHELGGDTLLPGLTDAHVHVWKVGQLRTTLLDLREAESAEDVAALVQARHRELPPGEWLWGRGWNGARQGLIPDRALLDALAPGRPVLLTRTCAHIHAVNTRALEAAGIGPDTPSPPGGELDYELGRLTETAYGLVYGARPTPTQAQFEVWILAGLTYLKSLGLTAVTDPAVDAPLYAAYWALDAAGRLPIRVNLLYIRRPDGGSDTLPLPEKYLSERLRCDSVKFFPDGGLSGATAAVSVPYLNLAPPNHGVLRLDSAELYELAREAHINGFRIGAHAIGDVALDQLLGVYTRLNAEHPGGRRHRIEHFGLPSAAHLQQAHALGVIAVPQPTFLHELRANYDRYIPPELAGQVFPLRAMFEAGLDVAFSSGDPVVRELRPLAGVQAAVSEAYVPGMNVTLAQAFGAYTHGDSHERGSLRPGFRADLTRVGGDPFHTEAHLLSGLPVHGAIVADPFVYGAPVAESEMT
ncbi:amidohydrolase [Deinococcus sp. QL22]|uniref:amidohydrolase n=1 Tax=Deinococcus sp. QL22 TaxID=2939437 RepID=UPI002017088A|nr:amidohydrolase [Deinococcus sp. QL22]UQN09706.1 amidohydrolase [Deinococcus sp. QL22]